jgi:hypothetical protein
VADGNGAYSMLRIWLDRGCDEMNHYRKIKWRRMRGGDREGEETMLVGVTRILLSKIMNKIHVVDSVATNEL